MSDHATLTLALDPDLLAAARAAAGRRNQAVETFVTDVLRDRLRPEAGEEHAGYLIGLLPERPGEPQPTNELVWRLLNETE